jgi:hypothetical protein
MWRKAWRVIAGITKPAAFGRFFFCVSPRLEYWNNRVMDDAEQ